MESLSVKIHVIESKSATTAVPLPFPAPSPSYLATVVVLLVVHLTLRLIMILHNYRVLLLSLLLQLSIENACRLCPAALDTRSTTINFSSRCTDTHTHTLIHTQLVGVSVEFAVSPCDLCAQSQSERALKNQKPQGRLCKTSKATGEVQAGGEGEAAVSWLAIKNCRRDLAIRLYATIYIYIADIYTGSRMCS